jgi:hypothetical protein
MSKLLFRSFAGGEITPEMFGRLDLVKFQTGLQKSLNFLTLPHGPQARRPGTQMINEVKTSTSAARLIPFVFSADQAVAIEFGEQTIRFHTSTGSVLEASQSITSIVGSTVNKNLHGYSVGDWIWFTDRFLKVGTAGLNSFTTTDLAGASAMATGTTMARLYTVASPYLASQLFDIHYAQDSDVLTLTHPSHATRELSRLGAASWTLTTVSFAPTLAAPTGVTVTPTKPTPTNVTTQTYVVTSVADDGVTESLASAADSDTNNLTLAGNYNTISWTTSGAARYNVYKLRGGAYGYIGQTTGLTIEDDNITPDTLKSPPEDIYDLNTGAGLYPAAVSYYEQRRWFGGPANFPQAMYATRSGTESNLTNSIPSRDDDALSFSIKAQQNNAIRHLLPLSDLIALTAGGEWRIFADGSPAITPTSLSTKPQGYAGASNVQPVLTSGTVLYVQAQGSRIREFAVNPDSAGTSYKSVDMSIIAPHLFNSKTLVDLAYTRAPEQRLWAVRSDGYLLSMTYVPEQQVYAWNQHNTDGLFESVCAIPENNEDALYAIVKRTIDGRTVRFVERFKTRLFDAQPDAYFVDCGVTYDSTAATTLDVLWHLEGKTATILADGSVATPQEVVSGSITLETAASVIHAGLPYDSDLQGLPLALEGAPAGGQGTTKNVNKVYIRVSRSSLVQAGPTFTKLRNYPARAVSDAYGSPPALLTGELSLSIDPSWNQDGSWCIRQSAPLPLTVLSVALDYATGG